MTDATPAELQAALAAAIATLQSWVALCDQTDQHPQIYRAAIVRVVEAIHILHGDPAWGIYLENAPEMAPIRQALGSVRVAVLTRGIWSAAR